MYLFSELNFLPLMLLLALWALGGWLLVSRIFDLPASERMWIGLGVGLTVQTCWKLNGKKPAGVPEHAVRPQAWASVTVTSKM